MSLSQLQRVESNLQRLSRHLPQLPVTESLILRAAIILGRDANALLDRLLKPAGLAEPEFRLLMSLLAHGGSASAGDLCSALAQSPANLTRVADALVDRGFVNRAPDAQDRRRILLKLRPAGEALLRDMLPGVSRGIESLFTGFSAAERKRMLASFKRLLAGIEARDAQVAPVRGKRR